MPALVDGAVRLAGHALNLPATLPAFEGSGHKSKETPLKTMAFETHAWAAGSPLVPVSTQRPTPPLPLVTTTTTTSTTTTTTTTTTTIRVL